MSEFREIKELDQNTIDQIAAGEVVERPLNVVKELVENAIDAGSTAITVEIWGGGIDLIRVTDNGSGIDRSQIHKAFLRHATSKLRTISDLYQISSLGFRGEALSSISAVAQVEVITKTEDSISGIHYKISGGKEEDVQEIGAPTGTTILVQNLFFNTPARKKFLKQPKTEGSYIADLMEHLALSNPEISFHFINNKDDRFHTTGNGDLKELIYRIYGRDIAMAVVPFHAKSSLFEMEGYLGEPSINRSNRNFETIFVNGRYVTDKMISKALEEGYKQYLMQHKFPFVVLHLKMRADQVDVNVHPSKMEVHFEKSQELYDFVRSTVEQTLRNREMIPSSGPMEESGRTSATGDNRDLVASSDPQPISTGSKGPQPFEGKRIASLVREQGKVFETGVSEKPVEISDSASGFSKEASSQRIWNSQPGTYRPSGKAYENDKNFSNGNAPVLENPPIREGNPSFEAFSFDDDRNEAVGEEQPMRSPSSEQPTNDDKELHIADSVQMTLFDNEKILTKSNRKEYHILGQIFDTYWIFAFRDKIYLIDQHAAHEKVNYERMLKRYHEGKVASQLLYPPVILTLSAAEENLFLQYRSYFERLGFVIDDFGGREYAMREVPTDLYGSANEKQMFEDILDELSGESGMRDPEVITGKIASMACKASVKGNMHMLPEEMEKLVDELLTLDNPYNCPHGRPTIISMSKYEIDKRFKRIL